MSGGAFEYKQNQVRYIAEELEEIIERQGKEREGDDRWSDSWGEQYPEYKLYEVFSEEVAEEFKKGIKALKIAYVYAQRIDWFLSGDDGEESFLRRLKEELDKIES